MAKIRVNDINVHYQTKGEGPDVILIHGVTSSLALWYTKVFPDLAKDFRVTAYDLRGHGLTDITESGYTSRDLAGDLRALMDALDIESAIVVGHSFGGVVGLHLALVEPSRVDGVVLLDSGIASLRHLRTIDSWSGWKRFSRHLSKFGISLRRFQELDKQQDISPVIRKSFDVPVQFGFRKGGSRATPRLKRLVDETKVGSEFRDVAGLTEDRLPEIETPVLAAYGMQSPYQKMATHLANVLPHCRYEMLEDGGHFYLLQEPGGVLERIRAFVRDPAGYVGAAEEPGRVEVASGETNQALS